MVHNKAVYIALAVNMEGKKEILGRYNIACKIIYEQLRLYIVKRCVGNRASTGRFELGESD